MRIDEISIKKDIELHKKYKTIYLVEEFSDRPSDFDLFPIGYFTRKDEAISYLRERENHGGQVARMVWDSGWKEYTINFDDDFIEFYIEKH